MNTAIIILLSASLLLFIISFFQKDKTRELEEEMEELSMTLLQDHHNLKKRIALLEEELLLEKQIVYPTSNANKMEEDRPVVHEVLKNQVLALHQQGIDLQRISKQSSLPPETVRKIIKTDTSAAGRLI
ncbi:MAG TPA: hypothetical protein DEO65_03905 [Bacillus bacterium]|uniref:Resolvase HTH domain-containing protein n=1 Tax=Siminovitchia fordii TaxID=254759 RepID=A0ABQ4K2J9_9BACI|nr:hypothetical protein [Siminovitchia fordii]GIN19996.1 hypothetical protein J1TS3_11300 [Siminovitchia fordii]HBZ09018.1 hypothetical protein [Bacillus sp. (in: firmicutes)]